VQRQLAEDASFFPRDRAYERMIAFVWDDGNEPRSTNASSAVCSSTSASLELWWSVVDQLVLGATQDVFDGVVLAHGAALDKGAVGSRPIGLRRDHSLTPGHNWWARAHAGAG
jgi:hypothetical protein